MKNRVRALVALVGACTAVVALPAAAPAASTISKLRVESGNRALSAGVNYLSDSARMRTSASQCNGSGEAQSVAGPSAIGIVQYAQQTNSLLRPYFVSDQFDFGLIVCRIGDESAFNSNEAWLYRVNHAAAQVGGDQYELKRRDEVLWHFADFASGQNTGDELDLSAPGRARPGVPFTVTALAYDSEGRPDPAEGVRVSGGSAPALTDSEGKARVSLGDDAYLRGSRGNDIPTAPTRVCVDNVLSRCPARPLERIVGTGVTDTILGLPSDDLVEGRGGNDRIDVRGGGVDRVRCGAGTDTVLNDAAPGTVDKVSGDCERFTRGSS